MNKSIPNPENLGDELCALITRLFPVHRSMTGDGVRKTLKMIHEITPVEIREVPSGTQVFDWQVPPEWNITDAYIEDDAGERILDFSVSNLHLVNGSRPVNETLIWTELKERLHTLPDRPDAIPYRTCFHRDDWGFCLAHRQFEELSRRPEARYKVVIDSEFRDGSLTYGEILIPGKSDHEVLLSAHICHPSLANDNLSGIAVATFLARALRQRAKLRYTYRIVYAPATIGAIAWLALNAETLPKIRHGLVLSLLGDPGAITYKKCRDSSARINRIVERVLESSGAPFQIRPFAPFGYDERQYCSPGINLPVGCLMRTPSGEFEEYHTSDDNPDFVKPEYLNASFQALTNVIHHLENEQVFQNNHPKTEPRLDRYGLYEGFPVDGDRKSAQQAVQWVLNLSDGNHSLTDIAETSGTPEALINETAARLAKLGLISPLY